MVSIGSPFGVSPEDIEKIEKRGIFMKKLSPSC